MRIGLALGSPYERLESYELELDIAHAARVDSIWLPDHLWGFYHPGLWDRMSYNDAGCSPDAFADPLVLAGILGQKTALPLGTIVTDATRRRAPDMVRAALTVHHMCPGGYLLGVGSGEAENNVPFGYPFDKPVSRLEQFLIEARSLLDHGRMPAPLHGTMGLPAAREGVGTMPLWVAAHGPRAMRLVGTYADGWISIFIDPDTFKAQRDTVAAHAAAAGRPAPATRCTVLLVLGESRDEVIERFEAEPLAKLITMTAPAALWEAFGLTKPGGGVGYSDMLIHDIPPEELADIAPKIPIEMVEALGVFIGNAGEIAARLEPYRAVGVDQMVVANYSGFVGGLERVADMKQQFVDLTQLLDTREEDGNE